jgi:hypothetical protein
MNPRVSRRPWPWTPLALLAAVAAACTPATVWERPGTSAPQAERDQTECAAAAAEGLS